MISYPIWKLWISWIDQQTSCTYVNKLKLDVSFWANQVAIVIITMIIHLAKILQSDWLRANSQYSHIVQKSHITQSILGWDVLII